MASTFTVSLAGKTAKPQGMGMKIVTGKMDIAFANGLESVEAADLDLKRLHYLSVSSGTITDMSINADVKSPGDLDNAATISVFISGSLTATEATLVDVSFLAIGE